MILCVGEILADMIGEKTDGVTAFKMYAGGAPFNVACNAAFCGAEAGFSGRVGKDIIGDFLVKFVGGMPLKFASVIKDEVRNTTLAFVALDDNGEREFTFFRHGTADYNMNIDDIDLNIKGLNIVHIGSLMLSERAGRIFAKELVNKIKEKGIAFSFDVNFRLDLYKDIDEAINAYKWFVERADILKFSDDEIISYTKTDNVDEAIKKLNFKGKLLAVTRGAEGSVYVYGGKQGIVQSVEKVKVVDTTGAGDAFYGAMLAKLDGRLNGLSEAEVKDAFVYANRIGALATTKKGAINKF